MTGTAGQPGPAMRRASAALPVARGGSMAGPSMEAVLPEPLDSCALVGEAPPVADAPSGRNGRGGANRNPWPNRTSKSSRSTTARSPSIRSAIRSMPKRPSRSDKIGGVNVGSRALPLIEQQRGRHLDEADAAVGEFPRLDPQIGDVIDREAEAALRQRREMFGLGGPKIAERRLLEFEHEGGRQRPVGFEKIQALREGGGIAERRRGDVAEHADVLVAHHQPAQHLHAFQHHHVIDPPDQPGGFRDRDEIVGGEKLVLVVAQPRHRLVEAHLALRQGHHRLQIDVDPVFLDGALHRGEDLRLAAGGRGLAGGGQPAATGGGAAFGALPTTTAAPSAPRRQACRPVRGLLPPHRPTACRHGSRPRPRAA